MKNLLTIFSALCILFVFSCGPVLSAQKPNEKSTRLPASSGAADRAALEKQKEQQKKAAEKQMNDARSVNSKTSADDRSSTQKKKFTGNNPQPSTGLPKD